VAAKPRRLPALRIKQSSTRYWTTCKSRVHLHHRRNGYPLHGLRLVCIALSGVVWAVLSPWYSGVVAFILHILFRII
jgi:hypothetical protein